MAFRVGQKVATTVDWMRREFATPQKGEVYTVFRILDCGTIGGSPLTGLLLLELQPPSGWVWNSNCFRPVVDTDIGVFTEILRKATRKDRVRT